MSTNASPPIRHNLSGLRSPTRETFAAAIASLPNYKRAVAWAYVWLQEAAVADLVRQRDRLAEQVNELETRLLAGRARSFGVESELIPGAAFTIERDGTAETSEYLEGGCLFPTAYGSCVRPPGHDGLHNGVWDHDAIEGVSQ